MQLVARYFDDRVEEHFDVLYTVHHTLVSCADTADAVALRGLCSKDGRDGLARASCAGFSPLSNISLPSKAWFDLKPSCLYASSMLAARNGKQTLSLFAKS